MSDLRDFTGKNRKFTGVEGERISVGSTAQRVDTLGTIRFNNTTNLMEYYNGTDWKAIDAPPVLNTINVDGAGDVTSVNIDNEESGNATIVIKGSLFDTTGASVTFIGSGENLTPATISRDSSTQLTVTIPYSDFDVSNSPYTLRVTNGSNLFAELGAAISADSTTITFTNAADTTYSVFDGDRTSGTITPAELCGASSTLGTITYAVTTGSLPTGFTLDTADGSIDWTSVSAVGVDTTTTFTITATGDDATASRQFKITVKAPVVETFTSTGAFTFSVPEGVSSVQALVVAGGGYGGGGTGGGGGGGGVVDISSFSVTPGGTVPGTVGAGSPAGNSITPGNGSNSTFGTLTAIGGGSGGWDNGAQGGRSPQPGGSGGGGSGYNPAAQGTTTGTQPAQPGDSGTFGFGFGGTNGNNSEGAGGAGAGASPNGNGSGGIGRQSSISGSATYYAGGGGGGGPTGPSNSHNGGQGGGGTGSPDWPGNPGGNQGGPAVANTGGGGGGAWDHGEPGGGGGSGIVIVKY